MDTPVTVPAISATGLTKTFHPRGGDLVRAVDGLDLTIESGEIVAFLGPNGAGKTTAVDMLLGLTSPSAGSLQVYGGPAAKAVAEGRVSAVMQTGGLLPDFTVAETLKAIATLHRCSDRVDDVIARTGLAPLAGRLVRACSGGEQQRLKFAIALIPDPDLIILDEPTTGMDVAARQAFWDTMRADAAAGRTIVFATHYLAEADEFAERTILMARGRKVADGRTADVRAAYGGRTISMKPPAHAVHPDGVDPAWLADVQRVLAPFGVTDLEVSSASLEAAFLALTGAPVIQPEGALA